MNADPTFFHNHLDICEQCRKHPFALCPVGQSILVSAASVETPRESFKGVSPLLDRLLTAAIEWAAKPDTRVGSPESVELYVAIKSYEKVYGE